ncbi:MAG: glutamate--tRNA ligase [Candidatus Eisenbacteria bacterium]
MANDRTRVRFAPSPTGFLHVGGARTALFNWLFARHAGGTFVLRLEDTDVARSYAEAEHDLVADLRWLGLDWDEGPDRGGPWGPYRQSERLGVYREVADSIIRAGKAYKCYCTDQELEARRKAALEAGGMPHYDGRCRRLGEREIAALEAEGRPASVRFVVEYHEVVIPDIVRGEVRFKTGMVGDFVILRSDGMPTYNFACVVDDWKMNITHVIRGEEHLSNTLRQSLVYEHLGLKPPIFAHLPLVLAPDRTKLSKRHGATSVGEMRALGYPPEAILNHLVLLGWSPGDDREIMTRPEIVERFSLERVSRSPSVFDRDKLEWITLHHIKLMGTDEIIAGILPYLEAKGGDTGDQALLARVAGALKDTGKKFPDLAEEAMIFLKTDDAIPLELAARLKSESAATAISGFLSALGQLGSGGPGPCTGQSGSVDRAAVSNLLAQLVKETGLKKGEVFMPLRIALTGATKGPEIPIVVEVLGKEKALGLLKRALALP